MAGGDTNPRLPGGFQKQKKHLAGAVQKQKDTSLSDIE